MCGMVDAVDGRRTVSALLFEFGWSTSICLCTHSKVEEGRLWMGLGGGSVAVVGAKERTYSPATGDLKFPTKPNAALAITSIAVLIALARRNWLFAADTI